MGFGFYTRAEKRFHLAIGLVFFGSGLSAVPRYEYDLLGEPIALLMGIAFGMVLFLALTNDGLEAKHGSVYAFEAALILLTCGSILVLYAYLYPAEFYAAIAGLGSGYLTGWVVFFRNGE